MALQSGEDVYATLLLSDTYLPGALVLAHSLRDAGTTKKLAVLVTLDTVAAAVVTELKNVYDYVIPVPRIKNEASPANLHLMNRPDLHSAFTKINLWKQAHFRKIVYLDADVVAYRAPDELFNLPHAFAAAPDIGWPDLFNTGVMVLTPDVGEYHALAAMAQRGVSFDGADQGLLNMHFKNYHRLPFRYNVTPSAHYQYLPAYRHFQSNIAMVHFIGPDKPWFQGRRASTGGGPYDEMVGQWWSVYDKHYRPTTPSLLSPSAGSQRTPAPPAPPPPEIVQYFVKGEYQPTVTYKLTADKPFVELERSSYGQHSETLPLPSSQAPSFAFHAHQPPQVHDDEAHGTHQHGWQEEHHEHEPAQPQNGNPDGSGHVQRRDFGYPAHAPHPAAVPPPQQTTPHTPAADDPSAVSVPDEKPHAETGEDQVSGHDAGSTHPPAPEPAQEAHHPPTEPSWDAQWQPPPANARPEAMNFPQTHYEMSHDTTPFVPPQRYPSPPRDMWYSVPKEAPAPPSQRPAPIFPWEVRQPTPTRVFAEPPPPPSPVHEPTASEIESGQSGLQPRQSFSEAGAEPSMFAGSPSADLDTEPTTPTVSSAVPALPVSDPWASFTRTNAWDDVPQIERYVDAFQKQHFRTRSRGFVSGGGQPRSGGIGGISDIGGGAGIGDDGGPIAPVWRRGSRITDFPSEVERPSLPVTPAPIRRPRHWGGGGPSFGADDGGAGSGSGGDGGGDEHLLPAAEGVPQQVDWDPVAQLQKLAEEQPQLLLQKLGLDNVEGSEQEEGEVREQEKRTGGIRAGRRGSGEARTIPLRPLPYGSEDIRSPTYVAQAPVVSPKPVKPGGLETSSVRNIFNNDRGGDGGEHGSGRSAETAAAAAATPPTFPDTVIPAMSYQGPGLVFEKDEGFPEHELTAALPSEEEKDVLDT
ncbi:glycosyl transferase, family 8 [Niveomyces insectorum RCEF 264]|uniref:glycogenin glucosyltransferase n=1 Tax=Niveomyces insectorum RCEF 264 TaxID=1081102 RepID=A0A167X4V3_9HYPO|nr:glycosyl transferase, family 8 [Niveomyces insectorum RCEF 264]